MGLRPQAANVSRTVRVALHDMMSAIATAIDLIDPKLNRHHKQVSFIATSLGRELDLPGDERNQVFVASLLHDIGALTLSERLDIMCGGNGRDLHRHGRLGALLLRQYFATAQYAGLVEHHHVPWNHGDGGTDHDGRAVPYLSHLINLADRIALQIDRHKQIFDQVPGILSTIRTCRDTQFNPTFVDAFETVANREAFWLDSVSPEIDGPLRTLTRLPDTVMDLDQLTAMARFFSLIIDTRSHFTATHSSGVAACAAEMAGLMGMSELERGKIAVAGYLHDIGKLAVPAEIIEKPGKLDERERQIVKSHPYHTERVLEKITGLEDVTRWAAHHHEVLTGDGYPYRIPADDLDLGARIMAVADIFTAVTEDRPYRPGMTAGQTRDLLQKVADDGVTDRAVTQVLLDNFKQVERVRIEAQAATYRTLEEFWALSGLDEPIDPAAIHARHGADREPPAAGPRPEGRTAD